MAHIQYMIYRSGTYYYNRRVPKHSAEVYGPFIRQALSSDPQEAKAYAERLSELLEGSWSTKAAIALIDIISVVEGFKPRTSLLSEMAEEYVELKDIDQKPPSVAMSVFISLAGDMHGWRWSRQSKGQTESGCSRDT